MRDSLIAIIMMGISVLIVLVGLAFAILVIYVQIKYANTPLGELPAWVFWITR